MVSRPPGPLLRWLLIAFVLFLRQPDSLLVPQFWAEDSTVFFKDAYHDPTARTLLKPYAGYLHPVPRGVMLAGVHLLKPERLPLLCNAVAILIAAGCFSFFSSRCFRPVVRSDTLRLAACALVAACHPGTEVISSITNVQWSMTIGSLALLAAPWRFGPALAAAVAYQLVAGVNCPLNLWLTPLALLLALFNRPRRAVSLALIAGIALHALLVLTLVDSSQRRDVFLQPAHVLGRMLLCLRDVTFYATSGHDVARWIVLRVGPPSWWAFAAVTLLPPLLLWRFGAKRQMRIVLCGYAASICCLLGRATVSSPTNPPSPEEFFALPHAQATRYYVLPYAAIIAALACLADAALRQAASSPSAARRAAARIACGVLLCMALGNLLGGLRNRPLEDMHWRRHIRDARAAGWKCAIPVNPGWWLMLDGPSPVVR